MFNKALSFAVAGWLIAMAPTFVLADVLPSPPTNVTATAGNGSATVAFTPGSIGSGTLVIYWAACGVDNTHLITVTGSNSPITVTGLTNGTVYYCWALTQSTVGYGAWSAKANPVTPIASGQALLPVYRFFNNNAGGHFFTISESEKATVIATYPWFHYEGVGFYAYATQVSGTSPVYRFFNNNAGGHFFTMTESEKATVINNYNWFRYEGPGFYAYASQVSGTSPVYRFYNNNAGGHFFTVSESEKATVINNYNWFRYEGVGFNACATSGTSSGGATSCSGTGGSGTSFTLMTNPTDGQILSAKGSDGTIVRYYGRRDANGIPESIDNIQVAATDGKITRIELDSAKRPTKMRSPDGVAFDLTYSGNQAAVTAVSPDGLTHVSTTFPVGTALTVLASSQLPGHSNISSINGIGTDHLPLVGAVASTADGFQESDWVISVEKCNVGVDNAFVSYTIGDSNGSPLAQGGEAKHIGGGKYVASIPTNLKPPLNNNQILDAASWTEGYLNNICDVLGQASHPEILLTSMCPYIGAALTTVIGPGGPIIGSSCAGVSAAVMLYCATLGMSGPPGSDSLAKKIIDGSKDPNHLPDAIQLRALSYTPGIGDDWSAPINVSARGPFPSTTISVMVPDGSCAEVKLTASPTTANIITGATQAFTATVSGSDNKGVKWSIQEGAAGGTISSTGIYTAPMVAGTYHVVATSLADPSKSAVATITVSPSTSSGGSGSGVAEWGQYHLKYTVTGATLVSPPAYTAPFGYDVYTYSGKLAGSTLTISGTGWVEQPSAADNDFNYVLYATVSVGSDSKTYTYTAPKGEILNKPFSLSVPIPAGATSGSFTMRVDYYNSNYGPRGVVVGGSLTK